MDALVGFHFINDDYDDKKHEEKDRHFFMRFSVEPNQRLLNIVNNEDDDFSDRLYELLDDLEIYEEDWNTGDADIFGWLYHYLPGEFSPESKLKKLRNFLRKEGFEGGDILEVNKEELELFEKSDKTQLLLLTELNNLFPGQVKNYTSLQ